MSDTIHGLKTVAGMQLSKFLRDIGDETTEVEGLDPKSGKPRIIKKTEALARTIWKLALGYSERRIERVDGKPKEVVKVVKPDLACISMIFERLEGKVAANTDAGKKQRKLSDRVSEQAKKRLNRLAVGGEDDAVS
jgi:hypothetical protein